MKMSGKSHVSMERNICLVCAKEYDTGAILLHRQLQPRLEPRTVTGWGLCPEDQRWFDDGFVALIECDPARSATPAAGELVHPGRAYRTGRVGHLKREVFLKLFTLQIAATVPCVFVEPPVMQKLEALYRASVS
jgi:hypothetical protein